MQGMTLENEYVRYVVGADGQSASFFDKAEQKERLSAEGSRAWMSVTKDGKTHSSASVSYDGKAGELTVGFGDSGVTARFKVKTKPRHFTFELTGLTGGEVTAMFLCQLPVRVDGLVGETVAVARDETFAAGVQAMNIKMEAGA
ncbi:MAG: hypothetical protein FJ272_11815, partial [Planctomycetes bacterium]|nr:hypothetical protein [Planctomycetota bacterium]